MAWYAELKRRQWYCINQMDMIRWYKKKLYDEWYASLTPEQLERLEEYRRKKKEKEDKEIRETLYQFLSFGSIIGRMYSKSSIWR